MKTFIRWPGNKSKHVNKILPFIPNTFNTYIEPFVGSGALFLKLEPKTWIINDLNEDIINVWQNVKDNPETIIQIFKEFGKRFKKMSKIKKVETCKHIVKNIETMSFDVKRAAIYMLMKHCAYMGSILINNQFKFKSLDLQILINNRCFFLEQNNYENIQSVSKFLNHTNGKIYNRDYKNILKKATQGDFVFLDPPYIEEHEYEFNYNRHEKLDNSFLHELLEEVIKIDQRGVKWLMTQADTKDVRNIFKDYTINIFKVYRVTSKTYVNELMITNYIVSNINI